jgi:hypothetical protein
MSRDKFYLSPFTGDDANSNVIYRDHWRPTLMAELSKHAYPTHEYGLVGFATQPVEYATYTLAPFVPLGEPVEPPMGSVADDWSRFRNRQEKFERQEDAYNVAVRAILANLGETPLETVRDNITRRFETNLREIISRLDAQYLIVTRQELISARETLVERYDSAKSFRAHVTKHRQVHNMHEMANQTMPEIDKIHCLAQSLVADADVKICLAQYFAATPDIRNQSFNDISTLIETLMANRPTNPNNEFALMAARTSSDEAGRELAALRKEILELKKASRPKSHFIASYCWTHGHCGHAGADCRSPARGHVNEATGTNRHGGNNGQANRK